MRPRRLLIPATLALTLGLAAPAMAAEWTVDVTSSFTFEPTERQVGVGDTVIWTFSDSGHTTTAREGQVESWDSTKSGGLFNDAGESFRHTFDRPGRFQYVCLPHQDFMRGTIQVGEDTEPDTVDKFRTAKRGNRVTIRFTLNEAAKATYRLRGPSAKSYKRARLRAGRRAFTLRNLEPGRYRGKLTLVDDFDKKTTQRNSFRIR
jgi:plastocyanin